MDICLLLSPVVLVDEVDGQGEGCKAGFFSHRRLHKQRWGGTHTWYMNPSVWTPGGNRCHYQEDTRRHGAQSLLPGHFPVPQSLG